MNFKQLIQDEDAVSPVIGVILMVAITVILAAVIATFVLGLGESVSQTSPQASIDFELDGSSATAYHNGGETLTASNLGVSVIGDGTASLSVSGSTEVTSGDTIGTYSGLADGDTLRVTWTSSEGGSSATLGEVEFNT